MNKFLRHFSLGIAVLICFSSSLPSHAQAHLPSPTFIEGATPGLFELEGEVSGSCPDGPTSIAGTFKLCGNNNKLLLSVDGQPAVELGALQIVVGPPGPVGPQGPAGPEGPRGLPGSPGPLIPVDYLLAVLMFSFGDRGTEISAGDVVAFVQAARVQADLTNATQARIVVDLGDDQGQTGAIAFCEYSIDHGKTWSLLSGPVDVSSTGTRVSEWALIPPKARADVLVRPHVEIGLGTAAIMKTVHLQVK